jgi:guanine deaminase
VPLQDWLQAHTFPLEARYADLDFATEAYTNLVATLLANGTTTALYFATIHLPATRKLAEICLAAGQRALIGRVAMDNPDQCPPIYRDASAAIAEAETRAFIAHVRAMEGNEAARVLPVITPRFIPACTDDLLHRLGRLAAQSGCHVQTHCSEGDWEHGYVQDRCGMSDAAALDGYGLLTRRTVLAHGVFVDDADLDRIKAAGAGLAHCPLSNAYFADAVFPLRHVLDRGVHVGLGTDIAGGASASMLESARHALIAARHLENGVDPSRPRATRGRPGARISAAEALWCATAGGGEALDLPIGMFRPGYHFDAIAIRPDPRGSNLAPHPDDCESDMLQKILYAATRADIGQVWVGGKEVRKEGLLF